MNIRSRIPPAHFAVRGTEMKRRLAVYVPYERAFAGGNAPGKAAPSARRFMSGSAFFRDLPQVVDEPVRILKLGGIAMLETPNPRKFFFSSRNFYLDPTHRHPLPSELSRRASRP
jgi:hypothetical protein